MELQLEHIYFGSMATKPKALHDEIRACRICAERFAATATAHEPRPVVWFDAPARILIAGQAPGMRVHESGQPFTDPSGDRLRDWMGIDTDTFYDRQRIAILPMAFCFPGYNAKGSDLPPPPICAKTWRDRALASLPKIELTLLIGGYAQSWHLGLPRKTGVTETVARWRNFLPDALPLPHPSWRNTGWLKKKSVVRGRASAGPPPLCPKGSRMTPLDTAHDRMTAQPDDDAARLAYFARLAEAELFVLLEAEAQRDQISPRMMTTRSGQFVIAFDLEERLTKYAEGTAPYAALSGRALAEMLAGQGIGLAINPGIAPTAFLIPPDALSWLAETLAVGPEETTDHPTSFGPPAGASEKLIRQIDAKLATAEGLAKAAYLARATYASGRSGLLLAFTGTLPDAEPALAQAIAEAVLFTDDGSTVDVVFLAEDTPALAELARSGLRFDLPQPPEPSIPSAPGSDPEKPPKLR